MNEWLSRLHGGEKLKCFTENDNIVYNLWVQLTFDVMCTVLQALVALVSDPEPEHPLRADLAEEYTKDRKKFMKNAEEFTKKYGEKRPDA